VQKLRARHVTEMYTRSDPEQRYFAYVPRSGGVDARVFVTVHGVSCNALEHATLFAPYCEEVGAVLVAPLFQGEDARDFQRLGREGMGSRADFALESILEDVCLLCGANPGPVHMFGFSGGAQFAHRFTMAYPQRVARLAIASAGWYTFPSRKRRYPYGIAHSRQLPDVRIDLEEFLQVPITVLVGEQDTSHVDLRRSRRVVRQQGENRLERAQNWVHAMRRAARQHQMESRVTFESLRGDHSFADLMQIGELGTRVFAALYDLPVATTSRNGDG
jgi:predicted esterase